MPDAVSLNPAQHAAASHDDGPLLVLAGAGTGKTATVAARVAHLLASGASPERVCLLTFSRRAAREMLERAGRLSDPSAARRVWGGTFHAVGHRLLRRYGSGIGLAPGFTVLGESDVPDLLRLVRHDLDLDGARGRRFPKAETLAKAYSRMVNAQEPLAAVLESSFPWCRSELEGVRAALHAYMARKRAHDLLDFDDLLLCWRALGEGDGAPFMSGLFDHVLVDEYQDTNALQGEIVAMLRPDGRGLTVVGDDAQAVYGFRAATPENIRSFPDRFAGTTVVHLEENYRSVNPILAVANAVMAEAGEGFTKDLWSSRPGGRRPVLRRTLDDVAQAKAVCDSVLAWREEGMRLQDQAVLFRAAHHSDVLEVELHRRNVPFVKYGGLRFLEAAHVKDLLCGLRILENPHDELAWFRLLQLVDGVGRATAARVMADLGVVRSDDRPVGVEPLGALAAGAARVAPAAREEFARLSAALEPRIGSTPGEDVDALRRFLDPTIERRFPDAAPRLADLDMLERLAAGYVSRSALLAELTLDPPASTADLAGDGPLDEDWLVLSTVHSAKGGEWRVVHVIHASDGMFPSDLATGRTAELEEERRLFYVAVTRARDALEINATQRYYFDRRGARDAHGYGQLSRFLSPAVRAHLDHEEAHDLDGRDGSEAASGADAGPAGLAAVDRLVSSLLG